MRFFSGTDREARQRGATRCVAATRSARCRGRRSGLTLVELLVVIIILTTLVAAALPIMAPNTETRRLREAARTLQTVVTTAQTKATELGRPYGIWLEKQSAAVQTQSAVAGTSPPDPDPRDMGAVLTVYFCEEPAPFAGFSYKSSVILTPEPNPPVRAEPTFVAAFGRHNPNVPPGEKPQFEPEPLPEGLFRPRDRLIVNNNVYQFMEESGPLNQTMTINGERFFNSNNFNRYVVKYVGKPVSLPYAGYTPEPEVQDFAGRTWTYPQPFKILRQPQKVGDPLQLPAGTAVDLEASGDRSYFYHDPQRTGGDSLQVGGGRNYNLAPVVVLFSPGGAVHSVIRNDGDIEDAGSLQKVVRAPSDGSIYLLVGRRERTGETSADPRLTTWLDPESLWVSIAPQTGRVVTEENRLLADEITATTAASWDYADLVAQRLKAREFARESQGMGGR